MLDPKINSLQRRKLHDQRKAVRQATSREKVMFEQALDRVRDNSLKVELDDLVRTLQREGERLAHFRSMGQLDHYKNKVKEFVAKVNRGTFKVKATGYTDLSGEYSTHLVVEKMDIALEELTKIVMDKESPTFQILQKLDLIRGMLTDLYQ